MSSEWVKTTLGEICKKQNGSIQTGPFGSQLHASDYVAVGTPVVMPANIGVDGGISEDGIARVNQADKERLSQHQLNLGDVVFSRRGDVTRNALIEPHQIGWLCGTGCLKVRLGDESIAKAKFITYYLRLSETKDWLIRHAVGATMLNLNTSILSAVPVTLPPPEIQVQITKILSAFDERITLLRETNKTLEAIAQAIFKSWFVDFDPVRAKMEGRQPAGMDEETAALFPDSFEEPEFEAVPCGWHSGCLNDLSTLNPESWTVKRHPENLVYVDLANTKENIISETPTYSFEIAPSRARRVLRTGDSIIGTVRPGNKSFAFVQTDLENLTGSTGFAVLRPLTSELAEFIYLSVTQESSIEYLAHVADGGAYPAVRPEVVSKIKTILPSERVLECFHLMVSPIFKSVASNQSKAETLSSLRDTLLPRLISGQLRLPEAQEQVEDALS